MSPKDFLKKFILAIVLVLLATYVFTYSEINRYSSNPQVFEHVSKGLNEDSPAAEVEIIDPMALSTGGTMANDGNELTPDKYPVPYSASGDIKKISSDNKSITFEQEDRSETSAAITETTEIFHGGERISVSDLKDADTIAVLGRKKSDSGTEFVADSIYVVDQPDTPLPINPESLLKENGQ